MSFPELEKERIAAKGTKNAKKIFFLNFVLRILCRLRRSFLIPNSNYFDFHSATIFSKSAVFAAGVAALPT